MHNRHTSRYFFWHAGQCYAAQLWTKLTFAYDTANHFLLGGTVSAGALQRLSATPTVMAQALLAVNAAGLRTGGRRSARGCSPSCRSCCTCPGAS